MTRALEQEDVKTIRQAEERLRHAPPEEFEAAMFELQRAVHNNAVRTVASLRPLTAASVREMMWDDRWSGVPHPGRGEHP